MPFEHAVGSAKRIAVIGGGISGMGAAYALSTTSRVTLFEEAPRLGGHAHTVMAGVRGDQPVDMGFIVFNYANYPLLGHLFDQLDVPVAKSNMSFAVSVNGGGFEYALNDLNGLLGQRRNIFRPKFARMMRDLVRFNARAREGISDPELTIGDLLADLGTGDWFRDYYILPFSGAIWSTPTQKVLDFPAQSMVQFFENHALLSATGQHQWYTVEGGSQEYVTRLTAALTGSGVSIRTNAGVRGVRRYPNRVEVRAADGTLEYFCLLYTSDAADE